MSGELDTLIEETSDGLAMKMGAATELTYALSHEVDVEGRTIYLVGELDESSGGIFLQMLRFLERRSSDPVTVWISSPGGDVTSEFAVHDAIRSSKVPVTTVGIGEVASAAGLILACGHRRFVTESTVFMAHEPKITGEEGVGLRAAKDRRVWEDWQHEHWATLMGRYCKGGKAFWRRAVEKGGEYWLIGGEAIVEAGVVDAIYR